MSALVAGEPQQRAPRRQDASSAPRDRDAKACRLPYAAALHLMRQFAVDGTPQNRAGWPRESVLD